MAGPLPSLTGWCAVSAALLDDEAQARRRLRCRRPCRGAPVETRVALQGLGTMGGATARFPTDATQGRGVADIKGTIAHPAGLGVEALLAARDPHGTVDRSALRPGDQELPGAAWLSADRDVLVPAAVSCAVGAGNQERITARRVVEASSMPVRPEGELLPAARGVTVLPDVVVDSGTNAWWWALFGDIGADAEEAFAHTRRSMRSLVERMPGRPRTGRRHDTEGRRPRARGGPAAGMAERFGWYRRRTARGPWAPRRTGRIHTSRGWTRVCRVTA